MGDPRRKDWSPAVLSKHHYYAVKRGEALPLGGLVPGTYEVMKSKEIKVKYHLDFDRFAADVAYALRRYIYYRSDGGRFARSMVRNSGHLINIHADYGKRSTPAETKIRLWAQIIRRKELLSSDRWVLSILFDAPDMPILGTPVNQAPLSAQAIQVVGKNNMAKMLDQALIAIDVYIPRFFPKLNMKKHQFLLKEMVNIAIRVGWPRNNDLWYYDPDSVKRYVNWNTGDKDRGEMTKGYIAGGIKPNVPALRDKFQGLTDNHKIFPFRDLTNLCAGRDSDDCAGTILARLDKALRQIDEGYEHLNFELQRQSQWVQAQSNNRIWEFQKHLSELSDDKDSLYSIWQHPTPGSKRIWSTK